MRILRKIAIKTSVQKTQKRSKKKLNYTQIISWKTLSYAFIYIYFFLI